LVFDVRHRGERLGHAFRMLSAKVSQIGTDGRWPRGLRLRALSNPPLPIDFGISSMPDSKPAV
jgi:hypothetical protein